MPDDLVYPHKVAPLGRVARLAATRQKYELLGNAEIAPLQGAEQAARLAAVIAGTGLDPWDAHVAAAADAAVCPILTLDAAKWRDHAGDLDEPLYIIEIADPGEAPPTTSAP